jgi:hypothetical protein
VGSFLSCCHNYNNERFGFFFLVAINTIGGGIYLCFLLLCNDEEDNSSLTKGEILDFILFFPHFWEWKPSEIISFHFFGEILPVNNKRLHYSVVTYVLTHARYLAGTKTFFPFVTQ